MIGSWSTRFLFVGVLAVLGACGGSEEGTDASIDAPAMVCATDEQCDDGIFCNGAEACAPGELGASALGCRAGDRPCAAAQMCDEDVDSCVSICGLRTDADRDGADASECGGADCDDADASRFPGAEERCNERDDDCDGMVDEGTACTDAGVDGGSDAGPADGGRDAAAPAADAGPPDGGPMPVGTCEACATHADCQAGSYCVSLTVGGRACVLGCYPDIPMCPRGFNCVLDVSAGVDTTICLPVGGACCVDEDRDLAGSGVGCGAPDCDDADDTVHPGAQELCNARDDDCDGAIDEAPTPCATGFCRPAAAGFEVVSGGVCSGGACAGGSATSCGGYLCQGDASGAMCAASCTVVGADDDARCIADYHCDGGACIADHPNGAACDEDSDCLMAHCDNGFCCSSGVCCGVVSDCPSGAVTLTCDDAATCQGSRDETSCLESRCATTAGIPDDTACDGSTYSRDCGLYAPRFCTGAADQSAPACSTSCTADGECIATAHCAAGACVPDRPPGAPCASADECRSGLFCADGVCCASACDGPCEACDAPTAGTCTATAGCGP